MFDTTNRYLFILFFRWPRNKIPSASSWSQLVFYFKRLTLTKPGGSASDKPDSPAAKMRENIVRRAALEFKDGMYANLGIGMQSSHFTERVQVQSRPESVNIFENSSLLSATGGQALGLLREPVASERGR